jgi:hypothetical protein
MNFHTVDANGHAALAWTKVQLIADDQHTLWAYNSFVNEDTGPLPIQLASFTTSIVTSSTTTLNWKTASETNNYGFEVQRSKNNTSGFVSLANSFVAGHGTVVNPHEYAWTDAAAIASEPWYRLKQIDLDGTLHYSEAVKASTVTAVDDERAPIVFALHQNYPNPFNPTTQFKFSVDKAAMTTLKVYNIIGQEVAQLFNGIAEPGKYYHLRLDGTRLASGVYLYRLQSGSRNDIKKMLLMK